MNISITGTRSAKNKHASKIYETLSGFIEHFKPEKMYFGGALGVDTIALMLSKKITLEVGINTELIVVFPDTKHQAPIDAAHAAVDYADDIIELENKIIRENGYKSYRTRNEYLVDHCDMLIGFPKDNNPRSGSWMTINIAEKQNKNVVIHKLENI